MNFQNISIIISHTFKILMRSRLLQVFFLFAWVCIMYVQVLNQSTDTNNIKYLASFSPYMNAFLFTLFQTLPLVVVAGGFLNRKRKIDTIEITYYHAESNTEYVWGTFWGGLFFFGLAAIISLFLGMLVRTSSSQFFFSLLLNCFYLLTLILPATVFVIGLSFFVSSWIKNQLLSQVILFGYVCLTFYAGDVYQGLWDFWGVTLPGAFSDFIGHPDLGKYLLHRGGWLCLGLAFVQLTVLRFDRIPNNPVRRRARNTAWVLSMAGIVLIFSFWGSNYTDRVSRREYIETYDKYAVAPKGTLVTQNIRYAQRGGKMDVSSEFLVSNQSGADIQELLLYLNPGLRVTSLANNDGALAYERENQVIRVKYSLAKGDSLRVYMKYEGKIDENVCYLDIPSHEVTETSKKAHLACRYGKRYAFLEEDFTLLIPEVLWYPVTVPPVNPCLPSEVSKNFTRYTLRVENSGRKTVISQGERNGEGKSIVFKNDIPLPGISLCMGNYMTRRMTIDSTVYELNILQDHKSLFYSMWNRKAVPAFDAISWARKKAEMTMGKSYPYSRFMLTEVPINFSSYFRRERGGSEFVQPELVFFPENGIGRRGSLKSIFKMKFFFINLLLKEDYAIESFSWNQLFGLDRLRGILRPIPIEEFPNNCYIASLFYNQLGAITSSDYTCMNTVINLILQNTNSIRLGGWKKFDAQIEEEAIYYLRDRSLKDAYEDKSIRFEVLNMIMTQKGRELLGLLETKGVCVDSVIIFLVDFQNKYKFKEVDFYVLDHEFKATFGVTWSSLLKQWYEKKGISRYLMKSWKCLLVETPDGEKLHVKFAIFNDSEVDGVVYLKTPRIYKDVSSFENMEMEGWDGPEYLWNYRTYEIKANTGIEVAMLEEDNVNFKGYLHTNIAYNLPRETGLYVYAVLDSDTSQYIRPVGKDYFIPDSNVIIVDNEDPGFKIVQPSRLRLGDYFHDKSLKPWNKYENFKAFLGINITDKWKYFISHDGYGDVVKTYLFKRAGEGKSNLEWDTQLCREGKHEVFVYLVTELMPDLGVPISQNYTLVSGDNEYPLRLVVPRRWNGWISLGDFNLKAGSCSVILSDKGVKGQVIVGDAVKWVYKGNM